MAELGFKHRFSDALSERKVWFHYIATLPIQRFKLLSLPLLLHPGMFSPTSAPPILSALWKNGCYLTLKKWPACHFLRSFLKFSQAFLFVYSLIIWCLAYLFTLFYSYLFTSFFSFFRQWTTLFLYTRYLACSRFYKYLLDE